MTGTEIGLIVSSACACFLVLFFLHEEKRGARHAERVRRHVDFFVLRTAHAFHQMLQYVSRHVIRQIAHYVFHVLLSSIHKSIRGFEQSLRLLIRTNKTLAQSAERERTERNKLEEIALHKIEVSLTEKQKQKHRDKALSGL